jgi:iron complex outermembrane recepter protein
MSSKNWRLAATVVITQTATAQAIAQTSPPALATSPAAAPTTASTHAAPVPPQKLAPVFVWGNAKRTDSPLPNDPNEATLSSGWDADAALSDLPVSATIIDDKQLRRLRPDRIEDLSALVPGMSVDVSAAGLSSAVKLRGFSLTRLQYDGVPDIDRYFARDLATVDRVEVLAGPAAVLFGVTSPGGVVNYVPKLPAFTNTGAPKSEWDVTVGSNALVRTMLDSTGSVNAEKTWAYRLVLAAQDGHTAVGSLPTRRQQALGALTWAYSQAPGAQGSITLDLQEQRNQTPFVFGTVITNGGDSSAPVQAAQVQYDQLYVLPGGGPTHRRYHSGGLRWEQALGASITLNAQYREAAVTRDETLLGFWTVDTPTELSGYYTAYHDSYRQHNLRVAADARFATGPLAHRASAGYAENKSKLLFTGVQSIADFALNVQQPDFSTVNVAALPTKRRFDNEAQRDASVWLADRISFGSSAAQLTHLTVGARRLRYAIDGDRKGVGLLPLAAESGTSAHVGISTSLVQGMQTYAAWSTGIEPNRGKTRDGNFLPPLRSSQQEAGMNWQMNSFAQLHAAVYQVDLLNLRLTDTQDRNASISAGHRRVKGVEASIETKAANWSLSANVSASRTAHISKTDSGRGDEFAGVPRATAGLTWGYDFAGVSGQPLRAWATTTAVGSRFADAENTVRVAGYTRVDLGAEYAVAQGRTLSAGVRNLGNRRYVEAVTALDDVYQGPLRQVWVRFAVSL